MAEDKLESKCKGYGVELILDLHNCDPKTFSRGSIKQFLKELCVLIDMEACDLHFWDDIDVPENEKQTSPQTKGTSAVQFIITSNITIHTLDLLGKVFINLFSCKDFDATEATAFCASWFCGNVTKQTILGRG